AAMQCVVLMALSFAAQGWGRLPADYVIGGLFQIHMEAQSDCFSADGYQHFQAMRFAMAEINNSTSLLPNVSLGYEVFDDCQINIDTLASFAFTRAPRCSHHPAVAAVIGPWQSQSAIITATILGLDLIPQISYGATVELLSDKRSFPSFFRTIPSEETQIDAILLLIRRFQWNWISVIGSSNQYGVNGKLKVIAGALANGICVAFQGTIPEHGLDSEREIAEIVGNIMHSRANAVVVFSEIVSAELFFRVAVGRNVTGKVWILSEDVSLQRLLSDIPNIWKIGTFLGIGVKRGQTDAGYMQFVQEAVYENLRYSELQNVSRASGDLTCGPINHRNLSIPSESLRLVLGYLDWRVAFNVYTAVYAVAHALHQLLQCNTGECNRSTEVYPWQALHAVRFSLHNTSVYFDRNGNPPMGYDIIHWAWNNQSVSFRVIGTYTSSPRELHIDETAILWHSEGNTQIPTSNCSNECEPGQFKEIVGFKACCFTCKDCPAGTFQNQSGLYEPSQWSTTRSVVCHNRTLLYLSWGSNISIALGALSGAGILLIAGIAALFVANLDTPVVRAAGGRLCLLVLASLACVYGSACLSIGKPNAAVCRVRQLVFGVSFTLCLSCLLVRSFQLVCIFKLATRLPRAYDYWVKYGGQYVFIAASTAVQFVFCLIWLLCDPGKMQPNYSFSETKMLLECANSTLLYVLLSNVGLVLLSLLCFSLAYWSKDLPKNYNEAKAISLSMALCLLAWTLWLLVLFSTSASFAVVGEASAILLCSYAITGGYFLPKCYVILFKPQHNTTAFFQTCIQAYTRSRSALDP
uniref:Taste receptor type 1 member 1-like n=1 Tax=Callorhinchus milii TaxID=7868 RepID=A0A4W3JII8_CALMI